MTTISIIIDGPKFDVKADFTPPVTKPDEDATQKLQVECFLVKEFMPKIKAMAENMVIDLQRRSKIANRQQRPNGHEITEIIPFPSPEATPESEGRQPDA